MSTSDGEQLLEEEEDDVVQMEEEDVPPKGTKKKKKLTGMTVIIAGALAFMVGVGIGLFVDIVVGLPEQEYHGAVAADAENCSLIGTDMIKKGGSAVDAAVAALLCIGVVHGQSSGLGGGGFMVVRDANGEAETFDFRTTAAGAATPNMFVNRSEDTLRGGLAVAVPGELKALAEAHKKYGKLNWEDLFKPSIDLARGGFKVDRSLAHAINASFDSFLSARLRETYAPQGIPLQENDTVVREDLAKTLSILANDSNALYTGDIASSIVKEVQNGGGFPGIMTLRDLRNYTIVRSRPLQTQFRGSTVLSMPPPASGAVLISILNIMGGYDGITNDTETYHRLVESFKFAYALRSHLGDPFDVNITKQVEELVQNMTSLSFAEELRNRISQNRTHKPSYYGHAFDFEETHGTTHVSVYGPDGDAVSVTSSVNTYFGSKLMTKTGIVLNNDMDDFSSPNITNFFGLPPSKNNFIKPGKRPLSSQSPTIIVTKKPNSKKEYVRLVVGAAGGTKITTATAQVILYALAMGESVTDAVERRRIHNQLLPNRTLIEHGFSEDIRKQLIAMHHNVHYARSTLAVVQAVMGTYSSDAAYDSDAEVELTAHSDSRKGGNSSVV